MPTRIEKDGDGVKAIISVQGRPDQIFRGLNHEEVLFKIGKAQEDASKKILEQKLALKTVRPEIDPVTPSTRFDAKPMSATEQMKVGKELNDPASAKAAFDKMVEASFGAPPDKVRETLTAAQGIIERERNAREASEFMRERSEYKPTPDNEQKIFSYLESHDMGFTARNCILAFDELKEFLELEDSAAAQPPVIPPPANGDGNPEPVTRPRSAMTGMPGGRAVASPASTRPGVQTDEEFMREVHRLTPPQYRERLGNPAFRDRVNGIEARRQAPRPQ